MKGKERHTVALGAYKKHVKEIEDWLEEMRVRQAATPLATESVSSLQEQLQENKARTFFIHLQYLDHLRMLAFYISDVYRQDTMEIEVSR